MAISPLAAVYATEGANNSALLNPDFMAAQPELQLAQGMMGQGFSTAPASPAASLARALSGAIGAGLQKSVISDLAKATSGSAGRAADILEREQPGNPAIGFLRSSDPYHQMLGLGMMQKTAPIQAELRALGPNQKMVGGNNATIATGSPTLGGAAAGEEAKARAPYEGGGDVTVQTPTGPQQIPATAATRAAMQPNVRPPGLTVQPSPSVAIPPPAPKSAPSEAPTDQSRVQAPGAIPGTNVAGKPLPNPAIEPAVRADTEELAKDREAASKGQQDMATVRVIHDFLPKITTGWSAETKLEGARILKAAGANDDQIKDFMNTNVAAGQLLQKKFLELSAGAARTMGAREPGSVIQMFAKAYPNLGTDPQAVVLQTNALYMDRLRGQRLAQEKTNFLNGSINDVQTTGQYRGLRGFNEAFNKAHPPEAYLSAAEAMSGRSEPWSRVTSTPEQNAIVRLIPPGSRYLAPNGKIHTRGAANE